VGHVLGIAARAGWRVIGKAQLSIRHGHVDTHLKRKNLSSISGGFGGAGFHTPVSAGIA
jgi:hypothetical protein